MIIVAHAFSRKNAGDGLLVDLTLDRLERLGIARSECVVVALDPESFSDHGSVVQAPGDPWNKMSGRVVRSAAGLLRLGLPDQIRPSDGLQELWTRADGIVGVGGGYLHAADWVEAGGVVINHATQLLLSSRCPAPSILLPQSIGPLRGPAGRWIKHLVGGQSLVCVRDDESLDDLAGIPTVTRIPDLAVLAMCNARLPSLPRPGDSTIIVPRRLGRPGSYEAQIERLIAGVETPLLAVQADVPGPKSDRTFIEQLGGRSAGQLVDLLDDRPGGVVISVRLHGAVQAILAGWPAIHLSYDRKGFGAFSDLGLRSYVHDARDFSAADVHEQAEAVRTDPSDYWACVDRALSRLRNEDRRLNRLLGEALRLDPATKTDG
jgi:hypothetical protein